MTPLRERMIDDLKLRNRSPRTIEAYIFQVARFAKFYSTTRKESPTTRHTPSSPASWTRAGRCCGAASPTR